MRTGFVMMRLLKNGKQADALANEVCDLMIPYKIRSLPLPAITELNLQSIKQ